MISSSYNGSKNNDKNNVFIRRFCFLLIFSAVCPTTVVMAFVDVRPPHQMTMRMKNTNAIMTMMRRRRHLPKLVSATTKVAASSSSFSFVDHTSTHVIPKHHNQLLALSMTMTDNHENSDDVNTEDGKVEVEEKIADKEEAEAEELSKASEKEEEDKHQQSSSSAIKSNKDVQVTSKDDDKQKEKKVHKNQGNNNMFDWSKEWYPVIPVRDLSTSIPNKVTLLNMDFVVWFHNPTQSWRVFADLCPHRFVPLSEGRIETNSDNSKSVLQCGYHGWEFEADGSCSKIPQLGVGLSTNSTSILENPRACSTPYPCCVVQDLLWILPTANEDGGDILSKLKKPATIPQLDDTENYIDSTKMFVRDMAFSWDLLVENLCDPSHVSFAHHNFMNGANRNDETGHAVNLQVVNKPTLLDGFSFEKENLLPGQKYHVQFQPPCLLFYDMSMGDTALGLGNYCIPIGPGRCRLIARFPFKLKSKLVMNIIKRTPTWITHFSQNVVIDSDAVILAMQDETLSSRLQEDNNSKTPPSYYLPAKSDLMVSAFRRWLIKFNNGQQQPKWLRNAAGGAVVNGNEQPQRTSLIGYSPSTTSISDGDRDGRFMSALHIPKREGRDAILDRYRQHTSICKSCRNAHRALYMIRSICKGVGAAALIIAALISNDIIQFQRRQRLRLMMTTIGSVLLFVIPRFILRPMITRMECVPWPRKKWIDAAAKKIPKIQYK